MSDDLPVRKHPAHGLLTFSGQYTLVCLTICTKNRHPWLANEAVHRDLRRAWQVADAWVVGRYVIMPDHLHLFAGQRELGVNLERWVRFWKSQFTRTHANRGHRWQPDHWDTRLRSSESYEEKWEYV